MKKQCVLEYKIQQDYMAWLYAYESYKQLVESENMTTDNYMLNVQLVFDNAVKVINDFISMSEKQKSEYINELQEVGKSIILLRNHFKSLISLENSSFDVKVTDSSFDLILMINYLYNILRRPIIPITRFIQ